MFALKRCVRFATSLVALALFLLAVSCPLSDNGLPRPYTRRIGPAGGTIEDPAGCTLTIPAGALAEETAITVTTFQDTMDLGTAFADLPGALFGVKLEPEGLVFAIPVTLRFTPARVIPAGEYPVFWYNAETRTWDQTGHAVTGTEGTYAETAITHFSSYSIFDLPYDVMDDFTDFFAHELSLDTPVEVIGNYFGPVHLEEVESFIGFDQFYNGCCYVRCGVEMSIYYIYRDTPYAGSWDYGENTEMSFVLSNSYNDGTLSYSIQLTVFLNCQIANTALSVTAADATLKRGESTDVTVRYTCGEALTPVPGQTITLSLDGPGRLVRANLSTDENGEATTSYRATDDGTATITASMENCGCGLSLTDPPVATIAVRGETFHVTVDFELDNLRWADDPFNVFFNLALGQYSVHYEFDVSVPRSGEYAFSGASAIPVTARQAYQDFVVTPGAAGCSATLGSVTISSAQLLVSGTVYNERPWTSDGHPDLSFELVLPGSPDDLLGILLPYSIVVQYTAGSECERSETFTMDQLADAIFLQRPSYSFAFHPINGVANGFGTIGLFDGNIVTGDCNGGVPPFDYVEHNGSFTISVVEIE